ncbi:RNA-directed DNA polymerase from mobile element jockey [Araneus ventricosus]|uniref:RNA-directed DNA polymerase from mobile element jockey n=1 Tax=Araneus ventricosus TaxID=182803 RepID=A0A4Y2DU42_ARAVE|nr:RNA-directed DNA polymerase from mobile element jockey [Araneus ventricosus]
MFHKNSKKDTDPSSLRPICLLDFFGKALDKLIMQRLFHHLLSNSHLNPHQFGFTAGKSATKAILQMKNWIAEARRQDKHSVVVSLDIKSAFSRVWWPLVLHKIKSFNSPRNLFNMVASFLEDRQVSMEYGTLKVTRSYSIGCPQGSNSGPLLWLIIANDALTISLPEDLKSSLMRMIFICSYRQQGSMWFETRYIKYCKSWKTGIKVPKWSSLTRRPN